MRITGDNAMQMYVYSIVLLFFSRVTFRDKTNQSVLSHLVHEVKALNRFF